MQRTALLVGTAILLATYGLAQAQSSSVTTGPNGSLSSTTTLPGHPSDQPCRVIGSDGRPRADNGNLSSTVTAGPNGVHSSTTGGPSVTVRSGDGRSSSTSSSVSSSSGGSTVVTGTGSGGDCTIQVDPDRNSDRSSKDE